MELIQQYPELVAFWVGLVGLCVGSYITMASYRLPLELETVVTPSFCPSCSHKLGARDLVPVLSWLMNMGRCGHCSVPVSVRYPITEIITAAVFLWIYSEYGISPAGALITGVAIGVIILVITDLEHYIIPDQIQIWLGLLGLIALLQLNLPVFPALGGALAGFVFGYILCVGYPMVRGIEGLGFGDVKFFAVAGLWLGWKDLIPFFIMSGALGVLLAIVWRGLGRGKYFPFGPALGITLLLFLVYPELPMWFWEELHTTMRDMIIPPTLEMQ